MNKKLLSAALLSSGMAVVGSAHAATVNTVLDVTAIVGQVCIVSTTPVNFGFIDPTKGGQTTGSITAACTPGMPYTIALDGGKNFDSMIPSRRIADGKGNFLPYDLGSPVIGWWWGDDFFMTPWSALHVTASSGNDVFQVDGFLNATFAFVPDGIYNDVVNVTVSY